MSKSVSYGRQWIHKDDIQAVAQILNSSFLTTGPVVEQFENALCVLTGAPYAVACTSGTAALHLSCMALGIGNQDVGLTSPNSFLASANCIEFCGGQADFIDIDPETLCICPECLEQYCLNHPPPRVVVAVDFAGLPADLPKIKTLADQYGFAVIEDAAHSIGSEYIMEGKAYACGSCAHSDLAIFSFHPVKTITTGEGGAVLTCSQALYERLKSLRNHGMIKTDALNRANGPWYYEMPALGYNYRITDIQCALGLSQLQRLDQFKKKRQNVVAAYNKAFSGDTRLILPHKDLESSACPHLYPIQFTGGSKVRKLMYDELASRNIFCQVHYIPIHTQPYYAKKYGYQKGKCPHSEAYYSKALSLPLFPAMADDQVDMVINALLAALDAYA